MEYLVLAAANAGLSIVGLRESSAENHCSMDLVFIATPTILGFAYGMVLPLLAKIFTRIGSLFQYVKKTFHLQNFVALHPPFWGNWMMIYFIVRRRFYRLFQYGLTLGAFSTGTGALGYFFSPDDTEKKLLHIQLIAGLTLYLFSFSSIANGVVTWLDEKFK